MVVLRVVKREKLQALSNWFVVGLSAAMALLCLAFLTGTLAVRYFAGYWWLAVLVCPPLSTSPGHSVVEELQYCRPAWYGADVNSSPKGQ